MMTKITPDQARTLAALVATMRTDWEAAGIYAALVQAKDRGDVFELGCATLKAASVKTNRTPAVIAMAGPHWATPGIERGAPSTVPAAGLPRCTVHAHEHDLAHNCRTCRSIWLETGVWPAGSQHHQATHTPAGPDVQSLAAHDIPEEEL